MPIENKIKERVSNAVAKSYYKPWYKRVSGRIFLAIVALILILTIYFVIKVSLSYYHLNKGEIYNQELGVWISEEQYVENQKIAADIATDDDPWLGADNPVVNIVAYESFGCPFCKEDQEVIKRVIEKFGILVRFTTKDFPTEGLHPGVFEAHLAASCANEQDVYWEYHDILFDNQGQFDKQNLKLLVKPLNIDNDQFDECLKDEKYRHEVRQDYASGVELGVEGTPSYLVNGNLLAGSLSYELWEDIIGVILKGDI